MSKKIPGLLSLMGTTVDRHYARQKYADNLTELIILILIVSLWVGLTDSPWSKFFPILGSVYFFGVLIDYFFFLRDGWKIKRGQSEYPHKKGVNR